MRSTPTTSAATARVARAFVERSCTDVEWFWEHALHDMGMPGTRRYSRLLDTSRGNAFADWFIGRRDEHRCGLRRPPRATARSPARPR